MLTSDKFTVADLPDLPHTRQLKAGFPWLTFEAELENEFRECHLDENVGHLRVNLCLGVAVALVFAGVDGMVLGPALNRVPSMIDVCVIVPALLGVLAASFSSRRHRIYPAIALAAGGVVGVGAVTIQLIAALKGVFLLLPGLLLTTLFTYFMGGLMFYRSLAANVAVLALYVAAGSALQLSNPEFGYDIISLVAFNTFCASVVYMHQKTSRLRFLEAGLLGELVARDGLTGIHNRRMFDQHVQRTWHQAVRQASEVALLLVDIDCFKDYNDRYGHQAGDECLRAVAATLNRCARRPLDFVARYGGEEFALVLYEANREYVAEVLTRIQSSIAELNISHDASSVSGRLTVSIGAAVVLPVAGRTPDGLIQLADEALYGAKEQGRNCVVVMESEYHTLRTGKFEKRRSIR